MEDDQDTRDGAQATPDSLLPYDQWMEDALRMVAVRALANTAAEGLPGAHHYYITFRTDFPGVTVPARLREKYPEEMTIVLQHDFDNLMVDEATRLFGVSLSFGGIRSHLVVPFDALTAFVDPHVQFGLRFRAVKPAAASPAAKEIAAPVGPDGEAPQVVSLDAFRRRKD